MNQNNDYRGIGGPVSAQIGRILGMVVLVACLSGEKLQASLYFSDGINYPAGTVLGNDSPWTNAQSSITVATNGLTFSNLVSGSPGSNQISVSTSSSSVYSCAPLTTAATNGNVYLSFLIKYTAFSSSFTRAGLLQSTNTPNPLVLASDPLDMVDGGYSSGFKLGIRAKNSASVYVTNSYSPLQIGTTYLVVLKYSFTNGSASMWVNPPIGGLEPASPDATSATAGGIVPDLSYVYFRSASSSDYLVDTIQVGSAWQDVTSTNLGSGLLAFTVQPSNSLAGAALSPITVQLENSSGYNLASNGVPVTLTLTGGTFTNGASSTSLTGNSGSAVFSNLVITAAGNYTVTATASGFNALASAAFAVAPAAIDHYALTAPSTAATGQPFAVSGVAVDIYGNTVTSASNVLTLGSSGSVLFDGNNNGTYGQSGDNVITLANGSFSINAEDTQSQTVTITATDSNGITGSSGSIVVSINSISPNGYMLLGFLNSLRVDKYWLVGTSVNFLTGAAGGSGPNMTVGTDSHCSAFSAAVAEFLGIYLLRPPQASDLNLANNQAVWFTTNTVGWTNLPTMSLAQQAANGGMLVVASYKASSGSGHSAVLRPSTRSSVDINNYGPEECQSGDYNFYDTNIVTGFNQHPGAFPTAITYWGHTVNYPLSPVQPVINQCTLSNQTFKTTLTTLAGRKYQVQWSSNLTTWSALATFTNNNSPSGFYTNTPFSDSAPANPVKFYRVLAE